MRSTIVAGDTLDFAESVADFPAPDWTLQYRLVPRSSASPVITINSTAEGTSHRIRAGSSTTSGWAAGEYAWAVYAQRTGERHTLQSGALTIKPDPAQLAPGTDTRSTARRALDEALAAQASYCAGNAMVAEYTINGRTMKFRSAVDFLPLISQLQAQVIREERAWSKTHGFGNPSRLHVRFGRG